jgi:hypothetical protein
MEPLDLAPLVTAIEESPDDPTVLAASLIQLAYIIGLMQDHITQLEDALAEVQAQRHRA